MKGTVLPRPKTRLHVVFMGLDGTGKSTQAARLGRFLAVAGLNPVVVHHFAPILKLTQVLKRRVHRRLLSIFKKTGVHTRYEGAPRRSSSQSRRSIGRLISWHVVFTGFWKSWYHYLRYSRRGLIYDRCFLDDLVKAQWRFGAGWRLGKILIRYAPKPNFLFFLDLAPELAYLREDVKHSTFQEFLAQVPIIEQVLALARENGWTLCNITIDELDIESVFALVREELKTISIESPCATDP